MPADRINAVSSVSLDRGECDENGPDRCRQLLWKAIDFNRLRLKLLVPPITAMPTPDVLAMIKRLESIRPSEESTCIQLINEITRTRQPIALKSLVDHARSSSREIRQAVAAALYRIRHPLSAFLLLPRLADSSSRVRQAALQALIYLGQPCTAESILAAVHCSPTLRQVFKDTVRKLTRRERSSLNEALKVAKDFDPQLDSLFTTLAKYFGDRPPESRQIEANPNANVVPEPATESPQPTRGRKHSPRYVSAAVLAKASLPSRFVSPPEPASGESPELAPHSFSISRPAMFEAESSPNTPVVRETPRVGNLGVAFPSSKLTFAPPAAVPEVSFTAWFREEILPSRVFTIFFTFYVHWITLLCLASIYIRSPELFTPMAFNAIFGEEDIEAVPLTAILETDGTPMMNTDVANSEAAPSAIESSDMIAQDQLAMSGIPSAIAAMAGTGSEGEPANAEMPAKAVASEDVRAPAQAVTAGSFSVWTVPDDPDPGEPYKIMIQIRVPNGTEKYSVSDLEGVIVGSDGYQKIIPGAVRGFLPVSNGMVKLEVHIVSADEKVEDTVFIRSRLLREAQRLTIRF